MRTILLDTTIASLLHPKKKKGEIRAMYEPHMQGCILAISFHTVAELWPWAEENSWGMKAREGLELVLHKFLIVPYDMELAKTWAVVSTHCKKQGRRLEAGDAWIAATAVHYHIPLLTHDKDHTELEVPNLDVISYVGYFEVQ